MQHDYQANSDQLVTGTIDYEMLAEGPFAKRLIDANRSELEKMSARLQ